MGHSHKSFEIHHPRKTFIYVYWRHSLKSLQFHHSKNKTKNKKEKSRHLNTQENRYTNHTVQTSIMQRNQYMQ